jgi:hypothetical protein
MDLDKKREKYFPSGRLAVLPWERLMTRPSGRCVKLSICTAIDLHLEEMKMLGGEIVQPQSRIEYVEVAAW